jgi:transcriptional regulator with XRE-family HTH domain
MKTLAERINQRLDSIGMKPVELSERLGISRASVTNWRNGKTKSINGNLLLNVAHVLQCDSQWLQRAP